MCCLTGQGDGKPRSAAMVLSMPHTTLERVLHIVNDQAPLIRQIRAETRTRDNFNQGAKEELELEEGAREEEGEEEHHSSVVSEEIVSVDAAAFDTVEATCKYNIYLQKQEDEMNR
jgi:tRNA U34 5-carboxymethylaminomethyl modifying enzyme MnmG/GidA